MGGFIKGMAVGLASFALGFAVLSVVLEPEVRPEMPAPEAEAERIAAPETTAEPERETNVAVDDAGAEPPASEDAPAPLEASVMREADPTELAAQETDAGAPDDAVAEGALPDGASAADVGVDDATGLASEPATVPAPAATTEPPVTEAPAGGEVGSEAEAAAETVPEAEAEATVDADSPAEDTSPAEAMAATEAETSAETEATTETEAPTEHEVPTEHEAPTAPEALAEADAPSDPEAPPATTQTPTVFRAVPSSPGVERIIDGVTVGRLPSIAPAENGVAEIGATENDAAPETAPDDAQTATQSEAGTEPARQRYAAPYDPAPGPKFAVVLLDAPADPAAEAAIIALPMSVAVALDPHDTDAPRRAQAYRAAGHEVIILATGLPEGATPADLEVTFDAWFRALPEAVALIDPAEGGFQGRRGLAQAIMPFLAADGHGLLTHERGLNPAQQSANSVGVANTTVFRIIDSDDENQFTIRRYLDRATFRAQQEGQVVVMGRAAHAETIDGLIGWRMEGRAGQVAIVPVSATLRLP